MKCIPVNTHTCIDTHMHMHACIYIYRHSQTCINTHLHTTIIEKSHKCTCIICVVISFSTRTHLCVFLSVCLPVCLSVCLSICMYVYLYVSLFLRYIETERERWTESCLIKTKSSTLSTSYVDLSTSTSATKYYSAKRTVPKTSKQSLTSNVYVMLKTYKEWLSIILRLTGDIQVSLCLRSFSEVIRCSACVPPGVVLGHVVDGKRPICEDLAPDDEGRGLADVHPVPEPRIGQVVRVALRLARETDPGTLEDCCILRRLNDVRVS